MAADKPGSFAARIFRTSWGWMGIVASPIGVARIVLPQASRAGAERELGVTDGEPLQEASARALLAQAQTQLMEFVAGKREALDLPPDLSAGTPFQRRVWRAALRIPYGRVRCYARAVGLALGANPVPILVPCHRVVAQDGSLGGFSCGLPAKRRLLTLEGTLSQLK
jgi:methylated-DNA-[protein]-cysteine S-methyltransferase